MEGRKELINKVSAYIEDHIEQDMDLDEISRIAGYSKFHLNRLFAEMTGCTIYKYIQKRRMTIAAEKLVYTNLPIAQIALEAGYHSQQAFTLAFRQGYGCPPNIYRRTGIFLPRQGKISMTATYRRYCKGFGVNGGMAA